MDSADAKHFYVSEPFANPDASGVYLANFSMHRPGIHRMPNPLTPED